MRHKIISISRAKARLLELSREVNEEGRAFLLTKDGAPVSVLIPVEDYEVLLEQEDILSNKETVFALRKALIDEKRGRLWQRSKSGAWVKVTRTKKAA